MGKIQKNQTADSSLGTLLFVNSQGKALNKLDIANLYESVTPPVPIGRKINGRNYLYKPKEIIDAKIAQLRAKGLNEQEIVEEFKDNLDFYQEMPLDHSRSYNNNNNLIYSVEKFDPSKSEDKFYVQFEDQTLQGKGTIQIDLHTRHSANPKYNDAAKITLYEIEPGVFRSKELVLVSSKEFDQYGPDNTIYDQTFLAALGGKVSVSYTNVLGETHTASAKVPVEKVVTINITVLKDENGKPLATPEQIAQQVALMQESYASCGIQIVAKEPINYVELSSDLSAKEGLNETSARELDEYLREKGYTTNQNINLIFAGDNYIGNFSQKDGVTFTAPEPGSTRELSTYNILVKSNPLLASSGSHELGHALTFSAANGNAQKLQAAGYNPKDNYSHHPDRSNLMFARQNPGEKNIFGSEHLTDTQINLMQQSPYAKTPGTPKPYEGLHSIPAIRF